MFLPVRDTFPGVIETFLQATNTYGYAINTLIFFTITFLLWVTSFLRLAHTHWPYFVAFMASIGSRLSPFWRLFGSMHCCLNVYRELNALAENLFVAGNSSVARPIARNKTKEKHGSRVIEFRDG